MTKKTTGKKKVEVAEQVEPTEKVEAKTGITVENVTKTWFVQPATNIRIGAGEVKLLEEDGWVHLQIQAGFFKVVK